MLFRGQGLSACDWVDFTSFSTREPILCVFILIFIFIHYHINSSQRGWVAGVTGTETVSHAYPYTERHERY